MEDTMAKRITGAQRAFDGAVFQLDKAITSIREARQNTPVPSRPRPPSGMVLAVPTGESEFDLTVKMTRRLREITRSEGRVVCIFRTRYSEKHCRAVQALWRQTGVAPPKIERTDLSLSDILLEQPMMIVMMPDNAAHVVEGYIKMTLENPNICFLLRK